MRTQQRHLWFNLNARKNPVARCSKLTQTARHISKLIPLQFINLQLHLANCLLFLKNQMTQALSTSPSKL
jgi:hypothetical protein